LGFFLYSENVRLQEDVPAFVPQHRHARAAACR
jgi:hypothetical protein